MYYFLRVKTVTSFSTFSNLSYNILFNSFISSSIFLHSNFLVGCLVWRNFNVSKLINQLAKAAISSSHMYHSTPHLLCKYNLASLHTLSLAFSKASLNPSSSRSSNVFNLNHLTTIALGNTS